MNGSQTSCAVSFSYFGTLSPIQELTMCDKLHQQQANLHTEPNMLWLLVPDIHPFVALLQHRESNDAWNQISWNWWTEQFWVRFMSLHFINCLTYLLQPSLTVLFVNLWRYLQCMSIAWEVGGLVGLVVTHSAARAKDLGFNSLVAKHIWNLILGPLLWQASSVDYALYVCNKLWPYNAV